MKKILFAVLLSAGLVLASSPSWAKGGYVTLYQDKGFVGQTLKVRVGKDIVDMLGVGFNDTCSSVKYNIPYGWTAIIYTDSSFRGRQYPMSGSSADSDMGTFEDKCSSIQWVRN